MNFVYPNFLWAYFLIAIPIIIHLFNFRRYRTVYFSRVKFLKEVTEDSRAGSKLKHLLVLAARILTIICLVTAFAQPFIPLDESQNTENVTSIYIDNSYSMQAQGKDGNLLNEAKNRAIDLVRSLDQNEKINLVTTDLLSVHQRFYSKSDVVDMIKEIDFSAKSTPLKTVMSLQIDLMNGLEEEANNRLFIFSDFQQTSNNLEGWAQEEVPTFYYKAVPEQKGNVYIDSVWFMTPVHRVNTPIDIHFRIYNNSDDEQIDLPVNLSINGSNPGPKRITIPANSFVDDKITFTDREPGIRSGELSIKTSQLFFDDEFYFSYEIKEEVKILLITGKDDRTINIEQLYGLDSYYNCQTTTISNVSQEDFNGKELIVLQNVDQIPSGIKDLLDDALKNGASIMLIPGNDLKLNSWNQYMSSHNLPTFMKADSVRSSLSYFNSADPLYIGVFEGDPDNYKYAKVHAAYDLFVVNSNNFITLFGVNEGKPYLYYSKQSNGRIIVMASPLMLRYTDFQNHALFAATMLRFAETASFEKPLYMEIGQMYNYPLNVDIDEKNPIHLKNEEFKVDVIPQLINTNSSRSISFNHLEDNISQAGIYDLSNDVNFNEKLAINFNRNESKTQRFTKEEIANNFTAAGWENAQEIAIDESGTIEINAFKAKEYWRILLILALVFIAAEILLLKLWNSTNKTKG
ncbi:MAG: BatA domain-containing protein [Crocinitomicaceae bacterium]|nr:BatA domain-containing protein [Crocinitomicaceae bacterium]